MDTAMSEPLRPATPEVPRAPEARPLLDAELGRHGAILFRGFPVGSVDAFEEAVRATSGEPLAYRERSSPRLQVAGHVYTSTEHPPDQSIFLHNEQSYNNVFPLKIYFYCVQASETGGGTPLADCRRVYQKIDPAVRDRFETGGYLYVRNFW